MAKTWNVNCDFKINLDLYITGKLANGYHSLSSLFLRVPGGDRLTLTVDVPTKKADISNLKQLLSTYPNVRNFTLAITSRQDLLGRSVIKQATLKALKNDLANNLVSQAWQYLTSVLIHSLTACLPDFIDISELIALSLRNKQLEASCKLQFYWRKLKPSTLKLYLELLCMANWHFYLEKHIPVQTGLGAGSFDAAAVWRLLYVVLEDYASSLNDVLTMSLSNFIACFALSDIAYNLGADIPFALQVACQLAKVQGIGEKITCLTNEQEAYLLLVKPNIAVNTKEAFLNYDVAIANEQSHKEQLNYKKQQQKVLSLWQQANFRALSKYASNSFYCLADTSRVNLSSFKQLLANNFSFDFIAMSGSGSAFYLLYKEEASCKRDMERLLGEASLKELKSAVAWLYFAQIPDKGHAQT